MESQPNITCGSCAYWSSEHEQCRRSHPVLSVVHIVRQRVNEVATFEDSVESSAYLDEDESLKVWWPSTDEYDWCGEWKQNTAQKESLT